MSVSLSDTCSESWKNENQVISQIDFIKQNSDNSFILQLIKQFQHSAQNITKLVNNYANGVSNILNALNLITKNGIIILMAYLMFGSRITLGELLFSVIVLPYFTSAITSITNTNIDFSALKAANDFIKVLKSGRAFNGHRQIDKIDNVSLKIDKVVAGNKTLIEEVDLKFRKGDIIGIIGESGVGKSTLAKLIVKFRHCLGISVNGIPIEEIENNSYLRRVSYYSQNAPIISDTILSNLNFGRAPLNETIYKGIPILHKFVNLQDVVYENGSNLSGGDKQRIAIARFFTEDVDIVIFDEPTSSLDKETESEILNSVFEQSKERIIFYISHTIENMRFCTHILAIDEKKVVLQKEPRDERP